MMLPSSMCLFGFNVAVAAFLCSGLALVAGSLCRNLPMRHATFVTGLTTCLATPLLVGIGWWFSTGLISMPLRQTSLALKLEPAPAVAQFSDEPLAARIDNRGQSDRALMRPASNLAENQTFKNVDVPSEISPRLAGTPSLNASSLDAQTPMQIGAIPSLLIVIWLVGIFAIASVNSAIGWLALV